MKVFAGSDIGKLRDLNEDSYYVSKENDDFKMCVIADGMGGYAGGEVASFMTVNAIKSYISNNYEKTVKLTNNLISLLKDATQYANMVVYDKAKEIAELGQMGTTLELVLLSNDNMYVSHIGDSRIYRIRDNKIIQITTDHTYVENLVYDGTISREEAKEHPKKHVLTKALGCTAFAEPDMLVEKIKENDIIVMCSDGLYSMLDENKILNIVLNNKDNPCKELISAANNEGGRDNITVIVIQN